MSFGETLTTGGREALEATGENERRRKTFCKKELATLWGGCQAFHLTGGVDLVKSMLARDVTVLYP